MPPGAEERATRREPSREAARRQVVTVLEVASAITSYAARKMIEVNGLGPEEARQATADVAGDLERAAASLRRLARPDPGRRQIDISSCASARRDDRGASARRAAAVELTASGVPAVQVAARLGVHPSTVRKWRHRAAELPPPTSSRPARPPTSATSFREVKPPK